jgi:hypothetical protein
LRVIVNYTLEYNDLASKIAKAKLEIAQVAVNSQLAADKMAELSKQNEAGTISIQEQIEALDGVKRGFGKIDKTTLDNINGQITGLKENLTSMKSTAVGELQSALEELGNTTLADSLMLEDLHYAEKKAEIEEQLAKAKGNAELVSMLTRVSELREQAHYKRMRELGVEHAAKAKADKEAAVKAKADKEAAIKAGKDAKNPTSNKSEPLNAQPEPTASNMPISSQQEESKQTTSREITARNELPLWNAVNTTTKNNLESSTMHTIRLVAPKGVAQIKTDVNVEEFLDLLKSAGMAAI